MQKRSKIQISAHAKRRLSERVKYANAKMLRSIIAHEVLHAYFLTMEHNNFWEIYRKRMNDRFGYDIKIKYSWEEIFL